jgi:hypothetical protein
VKDTHSHICLWGNNGPCDSGGFATREELNWHVKVEHLLICPVPKCAFPLEDASTASPRDVLNCHIRWAHKGVDPGNGSCQSSNLLNSVSKSQARMGEDLVDNQNQNVGGKQVAKATPVTDEKLKMDMSIGISKKRCRDQLKSVVAKRLKKSNGGSTQEMSIHGLRRLTCS